MRNMTMKAKGGDAYKKPQATGVEADRIGSPEFAAIKDDSTCLGNGKHDKS